MSKSDGTKNPAAAAPAATPKPVIVLPVEGRPDGKLAYETWVRKVGHADVAVAWEKLGAGVQAIWTAVAEACDRQTMAFLASEKRRLEAFRARTAPAPVVTRQKP